MRIIEKTPSYCHMLTNCIQMTHENQRFIEVRCNEYSGLCCTIVDAMENMVRNSSENAR